LPPAGQISLSVDTELHGHLSHLRQKFPDKPEDRQAGPTHAVLPRSRHLSASRPDFPRRGSDPRTPRAPGAPHYIPGHPGSDLPARLMTVIDPRDTPELPAIDLPGTRAATRCRPAPTTTPGIRFCRRECVALLAWLSARRYVKPWPAAWPRLPGTCGLALWASQVVARSGTPGARRRERPG
jgi:hypothetical protein